MDNTKIARHEADPIDTLTRQLSQASSILSIFQSTRDEGKPMMSNEIEVNALWCIEQCIDIAKEAADELAGVKS
jgi:uncharacterized protein YutE (UPF0331/DUF86 family)